jgi:Endonuclease/Exonuclease/phosphatase family
MRLSVFSVSSPPLPPRITLRHDPAMPIDHDAGYGSLLTTTVRIATWNVWGRYGPWEARLPAITETLRRVDADIVGLQEVWEDAESRRLRASPRHVDRRRRARRRDVRLRPLRRRHRTALLNEPGLDFRSMILTELAVDPAAFEAGTGWAIKPEGACKGEVCVPLPPAARTADGRVDVRVIADRLGMPLVTDVERGLSALGPDTAVTGRALTTVVAPELELPDADGNAFRLSSLRGQKVLLAAWASW